MFWKRGNNIFSTVAFRLALWYAVLLAVLSLAAFALVYLRLTSSLSRRLDEALISDAKEFEALYDNQGLEALKAEFQREAASGGVKRLFFQMFSPDLKVVAASDMSDWKGVGYPSATLESLSSGKELLQTITTPGQKHKVRVIYKNTTSGNIIEVGRTLKDNEVLMERYRETFGIGLLAVLVLGSIMGWFVASQAMSGVKRVTQTAVNIGSADLNRRVPMGNEGQEIHNLALAFNDMLERIQSLVTELKEVTNSIAHDLRSPITRIRGIAETTLTGEQRLDVYREMTSTVVEECDRLGGMINTMLEIAETQSGVVNLSTARIDMVRLVKDAYELFLPAAEDKRIILELGIQAEHLFVLGDVAKLQRVMANLLDNAINYTDSDGKVMVSVEGTQTHVKISMQDTGVGINEKDLNHVFERFYRADQSRSTPGIGLGLSLAQTTIEAHDGEITVKSSPGKGSIFTILLPRISTTN
ncbi:MAG: HAMP domain-containing histidine kinase [Phycisphaerae bacterium]|nr:HAMP domain-containing histidine kinase [Phycisphaerae bacterium]